MIETCNECEHSKAFSADGCNITFGCAKANRNVSRPQNKYATSYLILKPPEWCPRKDEDQRIDWTTTPPHIKE